MSDAIDRRDNILFHEIDKRLSIVEGYITNHITEERENRRWLRGLVLAFIIQFLGIVGLTIMGAIYIGGALQKMESIDVSQLRKETSTALQVLADHGTEIQSVRNEQFRLRGSIDDLNKNVRDATSRRFYKEDGDKLESRLKRVEDWYIDRDNKRINSNND